MKLVGIAICVGLVLLYFVNAALKIDIFTWEMLFHSGIRFFTGFIILGIGCFYEHKLKLKIAVYLILALVLADDVMDYFRHVDSFSAEFMLHNIYMLLWGALMGYLSMRYIKGKADNQP
jgi:hypothetical protein